MTATTTIHTVGCDPLTVHRAVMLTAGPEQLAEMVRVLTPAELELCEAGLARHAGDPVAAAGVRVPADVAATMRRLLAAEADR